MADTVGTAWIGISPFDDAFATKSRAIINAALRGIKPNIPLTVDQAALTASLGAAAAKIAAFSKLTGDAKINLDTSGAMMSFDAMKLAVQDLLQRSDNIPISMDNSKALAELFAVRTALMKLYSMSPDTINFDQIAATFYKLENRLQALEGQTTHLTADLDATDVLSKLVELAGGTEKLRAELATMRADVSDTAALAKIAALQVKADALAKALVLAPADSDWTPFEAQLLAVQAGYGKLKAAAAAADAAASAPPSFAGWGRWGGALGAIAAFQLPLFAGAIGTAYTAVAGEGRVLPPLIDHLLNTATGVHLATEAVIEFAAVWGPALVAVGIFSAAAAPEVKAIYAQLQNMNTAADGTGKSFDSLALAGASVTDAVKPSVLEAFGTGLYALQHDTGNLAGAMHTLGADLDQWVAKAAVAFDSRTLGTFIQNGVTDANMLIQSFASIGSILGTLAKAVPGYGQVLLGFGNDVLGVAAKVTSGIEPVLAEFLKLHGAILYGGLFGTASAWVFGQIVTAAIGVSGAIANMAARVMGDENLITVGAGKFLVALEDMPAGVVPAVGLVVGAFAAVMLILKTSKTAADNFNASIQKSVSSASLGTLMSALRSGVQQTSAQYVAAQQKMTQAQANYNAAASAGTTDLRGVGYQLNAARQAAGTYKSGLTSLTTEQVNVNANLTALAKAYGVSVPAALSLANGAQVTSNELTASGAANLNTLKAQVGGYVAQLGVMTAGTGSLNSALNALNVTQSSQVTDAQKLAQAYTSWIGIVTSGDSAFTTFEQNQAVLAGDLKSGSAAGTTLSVTVGKLNEKFATVGTTLNGTTTSALAARQAFDSQIQAAATLYGNLQTMAAASGNTTVAQTALAKAGKALVAQMLPMVAGSSQATAELFALAQIAGYGGVDSFKGLATWVGNTKNAEGTLNAQQTILTLGTANLTVAARNLSAAVGSAVTSAEAAAIIKTDGLQNATLNLASAFNASNGAASKAVITYSVAMYNSLIKAGEGATTAKGDVDAFLTQLGASTGVVNQVNKALASLPKNVTVNVATNVSGSGTVRALEGIGSPGATIGQNLLGEITFTAAGGIVAPGGVPAGQDGKLHMLAPGELVIPTSHAAKFADMARKASIPGFAGGGVAGLTSELGQLVPMAANADTRFSGATVQAFVKALQAAQATAAAGIGLAGVSNASALAALESAAAKAGWTGAQWQALYNVEMREAGFNLGAVNPASGAYGLAQFINGPSEYAQYGGNSTTAAGQAVAMVNYVRTRYGNPAAAWQHEQQFGWYGNGGVISEPVFGTGLNSGRGYVFGERGPEAVMPASQVAAGNPGMPPMTQYQGQQLISLLQTMVKQNAQAPYNAAQALSQANGQGVRRGYFAGTG